MLEENMTEKSVREVLKEKLRSNFDGKIVRKDLTKKIKEGANVPVYVLEFLLGQYCDRLIILLIILLYRLRISFYTIDDILSHMH